MRCMKKTLLFLLLFIFTSFNISAKQKTIRIFQNEKWWGGLVAKGYLMPFAADTVCYDLKDDHEGNQAVPFLVSSKGRYIWSEQPFSFNLNDNSILTNNSTDITVMQAGKTLKDAYLDAVKNYFKPTGVYPDPLLFTSPQYNTWIELLYNQNEKDVLRYAESIVRNGYPTGVLMIDDNWQKYYGNFEFKSEKFSDPQKMIKQLHDMGFKVMLWVCPLVSPDSPEFRQLHKKGYLIKKKSSPDEAAIIKWWNGYSACYDLTNPDAFNYLKSQLKTLQDIYGIDGFKFDAGDVEHYLGDVEFYNRKAQAVNQVKKWSELGLSFSFNEYRASWKMGGQPLVQRLKDKKYSWTDVSKLIPDMLAAGISGLYYTCPDMIGGGEFKSFENTELTGFDQELIVRSCQIHALMPMMQFSVAPWRILSKENEEICSHYARLHKQFGDYILQLAREASVSGEPIVRLMEYEFPNQGFAGCTDQFMLGDTYLVAPMITKGNKRSVSLPKGDWCDEQGKKYKGGETYSIDVPIERLPYFRILRDKNHKLSILNSQLSTH